MINKKITFDDFAEAIMEGANAENYLWNALSKHIGHDVCIAAYGDVSNPFSIALECNDCNEVIVDAETYTVKERIDI